MSGNFYDFDKDEAFSEVYINKPKKKPVLKEYEVEIPMPRGEIRSTVPKQPKTPSAPRKKAKPKSKMSSTALAFSIIGIAVSCVLVFVFSTLSVIFGWKYLPDFDKTEEKSVVGNVEKIDEYVKISDDGSTVEAIPYYRDVEGDESSQNDSEETDEDNSSEKDAEDTDNEENNVSDDNQEGGNDEVINID